jgi:hypothetical protein
VRGEFRLTLNPFWVTAAPFGGRGCLLFDLTAAGIIAFETAFEFDRG